ncbi:hypothetical protein T484DRAFT_1808237 [Baffinella frigidus]|nr:hypothetical protein T484DRAFT_1808237 [Cryptophyta sp. CCMP2293]
MCFQLGLLALATLLLSRSDPVGKEASRLPQTEGKLARHFPTQSAWSGFHPEGEDTDQLSALDWLSHHVEERKHQRCFGFLGKQRAEDSDEESESEEAEEGDIEEGESGEASAQPEVARRAWVLRAFCGVFCGKWHLLSANRRSRAQDYRAQKHQREHEAVQSIAKLYGEMFAGEFE